MPGFDGTGPQGRGPMTGNGGGYCLMKMPDAPGEPETGFAGLAGRSVMICNNSRQMNIVLLQDRLQGVQAALQELKWRLANLEAGDDNDSAGVSGSSDQADSSH